MTTFMRVNTYRLRARSLAGSRETELTPGTVIPFRSPEMSRRGPMSTIRVAKRSRFTTVDRRTIRDERLSFRARGVLVWLLDKPDDWSARADAIADSGIEGRKAVLTAMRELVEHGYMVRRKWQDEKGQWHHETVVYERPLSVSSDATTSPSPNVGEPTAGNGPLLESPTYEEREEPPNPHASQEEWKPADDELEAGRAAAKALFAKRDGVRFDARDESAA